MDESDHPAEPALLDYVRDPLAVPEAVRESRSRPMSERLAQALSIDAVAVELRAGMRKATGDSRP
jgi:hypothetical protein